MISNVFLDKNFRFIRII